MSRFICQAGSGGPEVLQQAVQIQAVFGRGFGQGVEQGMAKEAAMGLLFIAPKHLLGLPVLVQDLEEGHLRSDEFTFLGHFYSL